MGGAHAVQARLALCGLEDAPVRQLDAGDQAVLLVTAGLVHLVRPGRLGVGRGGLEKVRHGLDRHPARNLARGVPAHTVGNEEQMLAVNNCEAILVVGSFATDV